nr:uncharacterized protein LOC113735326 [Coffea arabica]
MASRSQVSSAAQETPFIGECSICLGDVVDNNSRAIAKLKCGHSFHLSCIGCEFNARGAMQCPNCRSMETSDWLYCMEAPGLDTIDEDPMLDVIAEESDEETSNADAEQEQEQEHQNQSFFQCLHGHPHCPGPDENDDAWPLRVYRPTGALQVGGNSSNVGFPDVGVPQHNYFPLTLARLAPPSTPLHASNINDAAIGLANNVVNYRPPAALVPIGPHFHPSLATYPILHGGNPPSPLMEVVLASRGGPYWVPRHELNLAGPEPSVFSQGRGCTTAADHHVELYMEQPPPLFPSTGDYGGNPSEAANPEDADAPRMIHFL